MSPIVGVLLLLILVMISVAEATPPDMIDAQKCLAELGYDPGIIGDLFSQAGLQKFVEALELWLQQTFGARSSTVDVFEVNDTLFEQCHAEKPMM